MNKHKIIIPGGAGFVGRNLVRFLISENTPPENITVIDKNIEGLQFLKKFKINLIEADLSENGVWHQAFFGKDIVIHLAAQISSCNEEDFIRNNILTTENIIKASKDASISKILYFSSAAVLSVRKDAYANTKLKGEELIKQSGLTYCILQPSMMYGPTDDKNIGYLISFAKKVPLFPIPGHGRWPRQPVYIDDICCLVMKLLTLFPENTVYSINGKDTIYFEDMVRDVFNELGGVKFMLHLPLPIFKELMMAYQTICRNTHFTADQVDSLSSCEVFPEYPWWDEFDIKATPFREGIRQMIQEEAKIT
jgi:nucleoside-diphosphate-sugar epimerase